VQSTEKSAAQTAGLSSFWERIRHLIASGFGSPNWLGSVRFWIGVLGAVVGAIVLLWLVDKVVLYYLARSYVDQVASALDLNPHLANALILLTFVVAIFFARFLWSFSRQRRIVGISGLAGLLIAHSLVLWWATREQTIDVGGNALKCYVISRDGNVTYREHPGIDPATGRECKPVKPEMVERLRDYQAGKRPQKVIAENPVFFDPRSSEPIVWYYQAKDGTIEIFDLMGFHPDTGEELLPITRDTAELWKKQQIEKARRIPELITNPKDYIFFDLRTGEARAWYWVSPNGRYEFYDNSGFHPQAGDKLQIVTQEIIKAWKDQQETPTLRPPNAVQITKDTVFFDPVTGNSRLWYWRKDKGEYEFFDGPGFHPQNGQPLQSFTKDMLIQYQQEIDEKAKQLKAEQDRIEAEQKAKREAENRRQHELQKKAEEEQRRREADAKRLSEAAKQCDDLAANPNDANRVGVGVYYGDLKPRAAEAVAACEAASKQNPNTLRFQYQLARALELTGDGVTRAKNRQHALEIHQVLVKAGYPAAYDNLGSVFRDKGDLTTAVAFYRRGIALNDSDSMFSLADLIGDKRVMPQAPGETPIELYKRAADLGNQNGVRGYQAEVAKAQQAQQQQVQQLQQQRLFLQFMGTVLRNVR
jgi:hypothetical protein